MTQRRTVVPPSGGPESTPRNPSIVLDSSAHNHLRSRSIEDEQENEDEDE